MLSMNIEKQPEEGVSQGDSDPITGKDRRKKRNLPKKEDQIEFCVPDEVAAQLEEDKLREEGKFG